MQTRYPDHLRGHNIDDMAYLYNQIYLADCHWSMKNHVTTAAIEEINEFVPLTNIGVGVRNRTVRSVKETEDTTNQQGYKVILNTTKEINTGKAYNEREEVLAKGLDDNANDKEVHSQQGHSVWEDVAHGMHKASITILGILFVENIIKLICMGRSFFLKKLEVFDSLIVFVSFVVDLVLLKGLTMFKVQEALFILSFLLPWRVIRVVNSLIVAILDHEHFQLKMLYKEKKLVIAQLNVLKDKEKRWDFHLQKIESFCESEGIPKWKIRQHTAMGRKQSTITSMASLALNGFLQGMIMSPSDKDFFEKTIERSIYAQNSVNSDRSAFTDTIDTTTVSLGVISENDDDDDVANDVTLQNNLRGSDVNCNTDDVKKDKATAEVTNKPDRGLIKCLSKGSLKRVSFDARERKPLLLRQDSIDLNILQSLSSDTDTDIV